MACFYYKGDKQYQNPQKMIQDFLKDNRILDSTDASIFSSLEIQENIVSRIKQQHNPTTFKSENYKSDLDFISEADQSIFRDISELKDVRRLTPEYIESNRAIKYVSDRLNEDIDIQKNIFVDHDRFTKVISDPEIAEMLKTFDSEGQDLVKTILKDFQDILDIEEGTKEIARTIKDMVRATVNETDPEDMEALFNRLYSKYGSEFIYGKDTPENRQRWFDKMTFIASEINTKVSANGKVLSDLKLVSTPEVFHDSGRLASTKTPRVKSSIDLIAVDSKGKTHIFQIKTAKNSFNQWDSSKILTNDWALAIKRQMLGQVVDLDNTALYIIPITVSKLGDVDKVKLGEIEVRTNDETSKLRGNGYINVIADKLLPRKVFPKYSPKRTAKLQNRLSQVIDEAYEIRTEAEDTNVDVIMAKVEKSFSRNGNSFKYFNPYLGVDGLARGDIIVKPESLDPKDMKDAKDKFRALMEKYVEFVKQQDNRGVSILYDAITHSLTVEEKLKTGKHQDRLRHILYEYLNKDWETIEIKEGIPMGMIVLRNKNTGVINLFSLSVDQWKANVKEEGLKDKSLEDSTYRDLDILKAMVFLDEFVKDLLPNQAYKMGQLITFNPKTADNFYVPMTEALKIYKKRMAAKGLDKEVNIKESDLMAVEDVALYDLLSVLGNYEGEHDKAFETITDILGDGHIQDMDKNRLVKALEAVWAEFPDYKHKTVNPKLNFGDPVEVVIALLQTAILTKSNIELHGDFRDLTKYSFQTADFKTLINNLYKKTHDEYDKLGNKIQGAFQGLVWSSPENIQSKDLRQINTMISTGNSVIGERFMKVNKKLTVITKEYYDTIGYNMLKRMTIGETQSRHAGMFLPGNNYVTKNPYKLDAENGLKDHERKYLTRMLLSINQNIVGISDEAIASINPDDINSIRTIEKFADLLDSGEYFHMPLIRREEMSKYEGAFKSNAGNTLNIKDMWSDYIRSWIDGRELSKHDVINAENQRRGFFHMYNPYNNQRGEIRAKMLQERSASYYEMNLDTIAHKVAFTKIRKQVFDMILPTINAYIWWIKLIDGKNTARDGSIDKQIEYVINQVKLAVMDEHLIGDEEAVLAKVASAIKQISTVSMLAFRPALTVKEMTIGVLKNFSAAGIKLDPEYNAKDMAKAYGKLLTIDNKFSDEFNLIDEINHEYRIANMDISSMPKKVQIDRWGVMKGLGRHMFYTSTIGDYYNRNAMLLSKMIHEGTYEAHSIDPKTKELVYDPTKDARFAKYFAERDKHVDKNGNYITKVGDIEYNTQRRRYLWTINQMNTEGALTEETKLTEKSLITKAYTHQERDSIKAAADQMYGAYDKDSMSHVHKTLYGIAFMQFLTYWPNKVKFYFGKRIEGEDSKIGQVKQATQTNEDGVKELLWNEEYTDENGMPQIRATTKNTGDPIWAFEGTPQEGTFIATMGILQDVFRQDWDNIKNESLRNRRAIFGFVDAGLLFLILGIMREIYKWLTEEQGRGTVSGELINFMGVVNEKVFREYNVWENTFKALNTEPLWVDWTRRSFKGLQDFVTGDKTLAQAATLSVGALEFLK